MHRDRRVHKPDSPLHKTIRYADKSELLSLQHEFFPELLRAHRWNHQSCLSSWQELACHSGYLPGQYDHRFVQYYLTLVLSNHVAAILYYSIIRELGSRTTDPTENNDKDRVIGSCGWSSRNPFAKVEHHKPRSNIWRVDGGLIYIDQLYELIVELSILLDTFRKFSRHSNCTKRFLEQHRWRKYRLNQTKKCAKSANPSIFF